MPPLPINATVLLAQTEVNDDDAVIVGLGLTLTFNVRVPVHPNELVPTTVYIVVAVGVTTTDVPDKFPGFHV